MTASRGLSPLSGVDKKQECFKNALEVTWRETLQTNCCPLRLHTSMSNKRVVTAADESCQQKGVKKNAITDKLKKDVHSTSTVLCWSFCIGEYSFFALYSSPFHGNISAYHPLQINIHTQRMHRQLMARTGLQCTVPLWMLDSPPKKNPKQTPR